VDAPATRREAILPFSGALVNAVMEGFMLEFVVLTLSGALVFTVLILVFSTRTRRRHDPGGWPTCRHHEDPTAPRCDRCSGTLRPPR